MTRRDLRRWRTAAQRADRGQQFGVARRCFLLHPIKPGLYPVKPGLNPVKPGLYPVNPGLQPIKPGFYPIEPGVDRLHVAAEHGCFGAEFSRVLDEDVKRAAVPYQRRTGNRHAFRNSVNACRRAGNVRPQCSHFRAQRQKCFCTAPRLFGSILTYVPIADQFFLQSSHPAFQFVSHHGYPFPYLLHDATT
jgi:hypothetical protein